MTSTARRLAVVSTAAGIVVVLAAGPALAHVEVEAAPARALATDALLSLTAEAESGTAGISGLRIQLPPGLVPADLRLASGPAGWRLAGSGGVVTVRGPALPVGRSLELGIRVRQLPDDRQLVLKTIQSYSDGKQDAWIELPSASVPVPDQPAPIVRLQPAAPGATAVPRTRRRRRPRPRPGRARHRRRAPPALRGLRPPRTRRMMGPRSGGCSAGCWPGSPCSVPSWWPPGGACDDLDVHRRGWRGGPQGGPDRGDPGRPLATPRAVDSVPGCPRTVEIRVRPALDLGWSLP